MARAKKVTAVDILKHARALLAKRGGWTKGVYAKNSSGLNVDLSDKAACRFCADGALMRAKRDLGALTGYIEAFDVVSAVTPSGNIIAFNDAQTTKRPVLAAFDEAIAKLEGQV